MESSNCIDYNENHYTILYSNADSLLNKREELGIMISDINPFIICITEMLPKNHKEIDVQREYHIPGYDLFFNNSPERGVAIYVLESLNAKLCLNITELNTSESVWCTLRLEERILLIGNIYRSPSSDKNLFIQGFRNTLLALKNVTYHNVLITGDFNFPSINWEVPCSTVPECMFTEYLNDAYLIQLVDQPTRFRENQTSNILDLVLCDDDTLIRDIKYINPLGESDHCVLNIILNISMNEKSVDKKDLHYFNYFKGDYDRCREQLSIFDWDCLSELSVNDSWLCLKEVLHTLQEDYIPIVKPRKRNFAICKTKSVKYKLKIKRRAFVDFLKNRTNENYRKYAHTRQDVKREIRRTTKDFERNLVNDFKENKKCFWKYVNKKLKRKTGIAALSTPDDVYVYDDKSKADVLNDFFISVFVDENTTNIPVCIDRSNDRILSDLVISKEAIFKKLNNLDCSKSMGTDNLHPKLLKELAFELSTPLYIIFNKSFNEGVLPTDWKIANVTAIFKKGDKGDPGNYRPVSLTCILCKVMESFIKDCILKYFECNNMFNDCQHGFRNNRSCATQLLEVMEDITTMIDEKKDIDIIYLDFKKAFDSVPHARLFEKLRSYGIGGCLLNWIKSFLSDRTQRVKVGSEFSDFGKVTSGIPQGSVLGPLLFIIFINDLPDVLLSNCRLFADDTKIYNSTGNSNILQDDLLSLFAWSKDWELKFNISKCHILHIGEKNPKEIYFTDEDYNDSLSEVNSERDVGVIFDPNLKFDLHINDVIKRANKMVGIIKRSFSHLDCFMFKTLFRTLVRPTLEYANCIWSPIYKRQSIAVENVQRRATKIVDTLHNLSYEERLRRLQLPSLKYRRVRGDLIQIYKIVHKIDNINSSKFFKYAACTSTRGGVFKIYKERCSSSVRANSIVFRIVDVWNSLLISSRTAKNINVFKNCVDDELSHLMYEFDE